MQEISVSFSFSLEQLAGDAVAAVESALAPRVLSPIERNLIQAVFWARASAARGEWVDIRLGGSAATLCLEKSFERGFVAQAMRMLGARKLELV